MRHEKTEKELRSIVLAAVRDYHQAEYAVKKPYRAGERIPYAGRLFDATEMEYLVDASLDFWLTAT